ncbi:MAG: hypothetical protein D6725_01105 [Planctomycetota bacterium]|nr:MAG: hypothetical protein D6725_01105 [Planctomycetota bacterium]
MRDATQGDGELEQLEKELVEKVEALVLEAEARTRPLELDPFRSRLFECFATAWRAGLMEESSQTDEGDGERPPSLTADELTKHLAARWGLADALKNALAQHAPLNNSDVSRLRLLWSVLRMWMEWEYAWRRWPDYNEQW